MVLKSFSSAVLLITGTHDAVPSASETLRTQPQASQRRMVWFGDNRIPVFCGVILLVVLQFDSFMLMEFARNEIHRKRKQNKTNSTDCDETLLGKFIISLIVLTLQCLVVSLRTIRFNHSKYLHTAHTSVFTCCILTSQPVPVAARSKA